MNNSSSNVSSFGHPKKPQQAPAGGSYPESSGDHAEDSGGFPSNEDRSPPPYLSSFSALRAKFNEQQWNVEQTSGKQKFISSFILPPISKKNYY